MLLYPSAVEERMSAGPDLQSHPGSEEWYIRANPDRQGELLFEGELELLRKKKKERISGILNSFFGASIIVIFIIFLYNYFYQ